jgi:hypothetical protein
MSRTDVALLSAPALGDGLLCLVLARNLLRAGREPVLYHTQLVALRDWFPWARIEPLPEGAAQRALLRESAAVFVGDATLVDAGAVRHGRDVIFEKARWDRRRPYLESLQRACAPVFGLRTWQDDVDARPPASAAPAVPRRVALHPTSARAAKNWPARRWVALAGRLRADGWRPEVLLAPGEEEVWRAQAGPAVPVAVPGALEAVADWLHACTACIGTDSGIAHLASALGRPTLTIFRKRSAARFWAPAWGRTAVVVPPWRLPGAGGHRYWNRLLRARRVHGAFRTLVGGRGPRE